MSFFEQIAAGTITNVGTNVGLGTVSNVGVVHNAGTVAALPDLPGGTVDLVSNLVKGTITKIEGGTIGQITDIDNGSLSNIAAIHNAGTVAALPDLPGGTIDLVTNLGGGTVQIDATPAGSATLTTHTLGTGGGTFVGTLVAPQGAGTSVYIAGLSIVARSGTVDAGIADNVAGTTGAGVLARGFFVPGGGIARDFNPAINIGANGTIAYFIVTAGTVDLTVNYWVSP